MRSMTMMFAAILICSLGANGQEQSPADEQEIAFELTGAPSASGRSANVKLEITNGTVKAFRVFAEPSHTLVAAFVDNSEGDPKVTAWYARLALPQGATIAMLPLQAGVRVNAQGKRPDPNDQKLALHIYGIWPGETEARDGVINVRINTDTFHFAIHQVHNRIQICCNGGDCGGNCRFCPGGDVRCCLENGCSFCGQAVAGCSSDPCPHC